MATDPDGAICDECGGWVAGEEAGACVCDDNLIGGNMTRYHEACGDVVDYAPDEDGISVLPRCMCDDSPRPLRAENTMTADIGLFPQTSMSVLHLENSGHTSLSATSLNTTVSIFNPSTASLRQIAEVCLAEVARREGQSTMFRQEDPCLKS
jgi:hypothetical protein